MSRKRIIERPQIGRDLLLQISRQESERFASLHRGPRQHDPADLLLLQRSDCHRHGEICLARPGGPDAEDDVVLLNRLDVMSLALRTGDDRGLS
jgi:hypothetical protein